MSNNGGYYAPEKPGQAHYNSLTNAFLRAVDQSHPQYQQGPYQGQPPPGQPMIYVQQQPPPPGAALLTFTTFGVVALLDAARLHSVARVLLAIIQIFTGNYITFFKPLDLYDGLREVKVSSVDRRIAVFSTQSMDAQPHIELTPAIGFKIIELPILRVFEFVWYQEHCATEDNL
ncbi:unnamed protein product [Cyclocybe aegerita]|uniref:Uncharacterized protein n=1 Tax=Cyclocybe aegerita TaxID=1973307 RepID=A0A8S0VZZ8_CYCAE|nr:unnamed protein product [Cyclocybe aegerita]